MKSLLVAALLFASIAHAHGHPPKKPPAPSTTSTATSTAHADASAKAIAKPTATSTATTGDSSAQANNAQSNTQESNVEFVSAQQAPSVAQGSVILSGCGAGGNAGGSNSHGAAFLGIAWTPEECYKLLLAEHYLALGMSEAACDVLNATVTAGKVFGPGGTPSCTREIPKPSDPPTAPAVTREDQKHAVDNLATQTAK